MTSVSFDHNHSSGEQNAPPLPGGRCEQPGSVQDMLAGNAALDLSGEVGPLIAVPCVSSLCCFAPSCKPEASFWVGANRKEVYL